MIGQSLISINSTPTFDFKDKARYAIKASSEVDPGILNEAMVRVARYALAFSYFMSSIFLTAFESPAWTM